MRFSIDEEDVGQGVPLAQALRIFWFSRGYLLEGRQLLGKLLSLSMEPAAKVGLPANAPAYSVRLQFIDHALAPAREALGEEEALAAWRSGQKLTADNAIKTALNAPD